MVVGQVIVGKTLQMVRRRAQGLLERVIDADEIDYAQLAKYYGNEPEALKQKPAPE